MLPQNNLDRIRIVFDDRRLVLQRRVSRKGPRAPLHGDLPRAWQLCGLAFREAISGQKLTKLRKRRCNTRDERQFGSEADGIPRDPRLPGGGLGS